MSKFYIQLTFEPDLKDVLILSEGHCHKYSDKNRNTQNLVASYYADFYNDTLCVQEPKSVVEELANELTILSLEAILQTPLCFNCSDFDLAQTSIIELYSRYINQEQNIDFDPELHFLVLTTLENKEHLDKIASLIHLIHETGNNLPIFVDVLIAPVKINTNIQLGTIKSNLSEIIELKNDYLDIVNNIFYSEMIDENGMCHQYDNTSIAILCGNMLRSLIYANEELTIDDPEFPISTYSMSVLEIDKYKIINNLHLSYLQQIAEPIIQANIDDDCVDIEKVQKIFREIYTAAKEQLTDYFSKGVVSECDLLEDFRSKLHGYLIGTDLNNKEKQLLISYCKNLGTIGSDDIDDIDFNKLPVIDTLLIDGLSALGEDCQIFEQLKEVSKRINSGKTKIVELKNKIEEKRQFLNPDVEFDGALTHEGFNIHGRRYQSYGFDETPLSEDYEPSLNNPPQNANLKDYFSVVKDQGTQGACASFSLVSVFEYFLSNAVNAEMDLSEAYVYYNARKISDDTDNDNGVSLQNVIKAMTDSGICVEELCPYDQNTYSEKPSDDAYEDGHKRKILDAKNVPIDIAKIKLAIADGYPVVASFKIYDSFTKNIKGFVSMPTEEELKSSVKEYHAMVICGYSDEQSYFIVRNSWGEDFGDKGYCYIPYSYVRNPELTRYACIITGIDVQTPRHSVKEFTFNSEELDNNIQYAIVCNQLLELEYSIEQEKRKLYDNIKQYQKLLLKVQSESYLSNVEATLQKEKEQISKQLESNNNGQKKGLSTTSNIIFLIGLIIAAIPLIVGLFSNNHEELFGGATAFLVIAIGWLVTQIVVSRKRAREVESNILAQQSRLHDIEKKIAEIAGIKTQLKQLIVDIALFAKDANCEGELLSHILTCVVSLHRISSNRLNKEDLIFRGENLIERFNKLGMNVLIEKLNILKNLLIKGETSEGIYSGFREIQKRILLKLNDLFNLDVRTFVGTPLWRDYEATIMREPLLSRVTMTSDEPIKKVFFTKDGKDIRNVYNINVDNNQYLFIKVVGVKLKQLESLTL